MKQRLAIWMLAVLLCLAPTITKADSVNTIVGTSAKGTDLSWKHLRAYRMDLQGGTGQPIGTGDFALATFAMSGACLNATCSQFVPSLSTDKTIATTFAPAGNNLPSYIGINYFWNQTGGNDTTGAFRREIGGYTDLPALGFQAAGLERTRNTLNTLNSGIVWREATTESVSSVTPSGIGAVLPYLLTGTTTLNRAWSVNNTPSDPLSGLGIQSVGNFGYIGGGNWTRLQTAAVLNLTATTSIGASLNVPLSTWSVTNTPAVATQATASKAAGGGTVRHVATTITVCLAAGATAQTPILAHLRDGATGAGTILRSWAISAPINNSECQDLSGLAMIGTANTAMTIEFTGAGVAGSQETVTLTGFSVP